MKLREVERRLLEALEDAYRDGRGVLETQELHVEEAGRPLDTALITVMLEGLKRRGLVIGFLSQIRMTRMWGISEKGQAVLKD